MACCQVTVRGPLAGTVLETLDARFDSVSAVRGPAESVLAVEGIDQAALRALLILLWDTGHEIVRLTSGPCAARPSPSA